MADLECFLKPKSVAVIGVSRQPGFSWGRGIFQNLVGAGFQGRVYPVNPQAGEIAGLKAYPDLASIPGDVDLAVIAVPIGLVQAVIHDCVQKRVKGAILVTAGYAETSEGKGLQAELTEVAKTSGMRIVGPNVSGIFNVSANLDASIVNYSYLRDTPIAFICQGGYAINDLIYRSYKKGMGIGKYLHTGNECDVTVTDFLEYAGADPEVKVILMYLEGLRDGRRFLEVAKRVSQEKPIIAIKAGGTEDGARAASSHTGAIAGSDLIFDAALKQANVIRSPKMELMLYLGHAFLELPPLRGNRIGVVTGGGSWGVMITDALNRKGLDVPELSPGMRQKLHGLGMPYWASTRNPVDLGAAGGSKWIGGGAMVAEELLYSDEVDGLLVHGFGHAGFMGNDPSADLGMAYQVEERMLRKISELIPSYDKPILVCSYFSESDSEAIDTIVREGTRVYHDVEDAATALASLYRYYCRLRL